MPSAFGHALASFGLSRLGFVSKPNYKMIWLGMILSILPDADSIGFRYGIPYSSFWGHRGFSHSLLFAFLVSLLCTLFFRLEPKRKFGVFLFLFFSCASHAVLDAMTSGGLGVAFFSPFDNSRYFFSFRPIQVSPIHIRAFFSEWGMRVVKSELLWVGLPVLFIIIVSLIFRKPSKKLSSNGEATKNIS